MTDKQQPEALDFADWLEAVVGGTSAKRCAALLRRLHAENETLRAKLKVYEDLGDAGSDVQLLRMGYTAARLEIESLRGKGWQPIETAPKDGRNLLLGYFNSAGKWRTTRGEWLSQDYIDEYAEDPDCTSPGWHETTVEDDDGKCWPIDPSHWMPLPLPPTSAEGVEHG